MAGVKKTSQVLIVDDEPDLRNLLTLTLGKMGVKTVEAEDLASARRTLVSDRFDLVLTDMNLPDGNGLDFVYWMQEQAPSVPVAMITAYGSMDIAVDALKAGAFDFIAKPVDLLRLRTLVRDALALDAAEAPNESAAAQLLGNSAQMHELRTVITRMARSQAPVLITGESGTGKELAARLIHTSGPRAAHPFVPVNCGAIPAELVESELFGHRKGSFTGAHTDRPGLIRSAEGGTLFLDEIGELPLPMQVKLLRVIQERRVRAVGATQEVPVDVRFVSATHQDLTLALAEGRFREDLYYRINVIDLHVPPLRERRGDIPLLAEALLTRMCTMAGTATKKLTPEAIALLEGHPFPGNVRELENVLERAFALTESDTIGAADIHLRRSPRRAEADAAAKPDAEALPEMLNDVERQAIQKALRETGGNRTAAARLLGMTFRQLRYRLQKLDIKP
ncbi:MAG: sigma-54 dependent transcriptional regulator [Gammaproteobacteria bacterium]